MAKYKDSIDLYDDEGKLLKSGVTIDRISPVVNKGALQVIDLTKRTVAVNLAGIEDALKTGKVGGKSNQILGRSMSCSCVKDCDAIAAKIKDMVQVADGDNTKITKVGGGKMLLVECPTARMDAAATYDVASTVVAAATTYALVDQYKVGMFDGSYIKAAVWGTYPQTMDMQGGNVISILSIPYGPAKGCPNPHPMRKVICIGDQSIELQTHVGTILLEIASREIIPALQSACEEVFTSFSFRIQEGRYMKTEPSLVDYAKYGPHADKTIIGMVDPKSRSGPVILQGIK
eukprot:TRINITY_DN274_c0_g1_i8.p1 TRINITY_DN274_c0_g1~~TRINITY_DN274_c0_g1_i8.p1  ORF type:complete len:289 (-),score=49.08 TRINITY_DN274_c0_g1_i8:901-1767(-)